MVQYFNRFAYRYGCNAAVHSILAQFYRVLRTIDYRKLLIQVAFSATIIPMK